MHLMNVLTLFGTEEKAKQWLVEKLWKKRCLFRLGSKTLKFLLH